MTSYTVFCFWFALLLSTSTILATLACNSSVSCNCGSSHNIYKLCIDNLRSQIDPCVLWSHCRTCRDNVPHCVTCPENRTGPTCSEVKQLRRKRQYMMANQNMTRSRSRNTSYYGSPIDEVTECTLPDADVNGFVEGRPQSYRRRKERFPPGTQLTFGCRSGYRSVGAIKLFCLLTGEWSSLPPICEETEPVETDVTCNYPRVDPNGKIEESDHMNPMLTSQKFHPGTELTYTCNEGFQLEGANVLFCLSNGEWTSSAPTCAQDLRTNGTCRRLETPDSGTISCRETSNDRSCTGRCFPGYNFMDSTQEQITLKCKRGTWTPRLTFPPCISGGHCDLVVDGDGSFNCSTDMDGTDCNIYCSGIYQGRYHCFPKRGWNPLLPHCVKPKELGNSLVSLVNCQNKPPISNGKVEIIYKNPDEARRPGDEIPSYPPGIRLEYSCEPKHILIGSNTLMCLQNGKWSTDQPICIEDCGLSRLRPTRRISNGEPTTAGEWPWTVAISTASNRNYIMCGGALLDRRTVLTAAHCVVGHSSMILKFGKHRRANSNDKEIVKEGWTTRIVTHEDYNNKTYENDIALLRFEPSVRYNDFIQPICLPTPSTSRKNVASGRTGKVTGWGLNEVQRLSSELMVASLRVQPNDECMEAYAEHGIYDRIHPGMFCAGFKAGVVSACRGDSGSPLVFLDDETHRYTIEGLVSFGQSTKECGSPRAYTVFSKVAYYMPWIRRNWP